VNGNVSTPLTYDFRTDPIPEFDNDESLDNKYHLGMIIHYNQSSKESENGDYEKIKP